jgi:hypothetical protein
MVLDPGILRAISSKGSPLVRLDQSSGLADAHIGVYVRLLQKKKVRHTAGRTSTAPLSNKVYKVVLSKIHSKPYIS